MLLPENMAETQAQIIWKRGPLKDHSNDFTIKSNGLEPSSLELDQVFRKKTTFYHSTTSIQKKVSSLKIKVKNDQTNGVFQTLQSENVDLSKYAYKAMVGKQNPFSIEFK